MAVAGTDMEPVKVSRAESLSRQIQQYIVDSGLKAGDRLGTKHELRERFGVAVATVNEALRLLEIHGLVEARPGPGNGVFVAATPSRVRLNHLVLGFKMGDAPFSDCLAVRNALEPLVCREAAKNGRPRDARALRQIVGRMERRLDEPLEFLRLNWELHRRMANLCSNEPLRMLYLTLLDYVEDGLQEVESDEFFDADANLRVHQELVEAIIANEPRRLSKAIQLHMPMADRWVEDGP
jgi:DNA-binding FadR family transcriptional regulator